MTPQEAEELAALWTGSQTAVAAFIRTLVPRRDESEELLQRTAVTLVRKFQRVQSPSAFRCVGHWGRQDRGARILAGEGFGPTRV